MDDKNAAEEAQDIIHKMIEHLETGPQPNGPQNLAEAFLWAALGPPPGRDEERKN